jgi:aminobenzoyl-glutamate transport protein
VGVSVTEQIAEPVPYPVQHNYYEDTTEVQSQVPAQGNEYSNVQFTMREETIPVKGLLTIDGIRFIFTSFVANFQNFGHDVAWSQFARLLSSTAAWAGRR